MSAPRLEKPVPYVWARDLAALRKYYRETLGFEEQYEFLWDDGTRPDGKGGIVGMTRGDVELQVATCGCPDRRHDGLAFFIVYTQGVEALYEELTGRGATVQCELKREDWGGTSFTIEDPDGNRILFLQLP